MMNKTSMIAIALLVFMGLYPLFVDSAWLCGDQQQVADALGFAFGEVS